MISSPYSKEVNTSVVRPVFSDPESTGTEAESFTAADDIWVGIHFPRIALAVFDLPDGIPFTVIEEVKGRHIIHSPCDIALAQGIMPGMPLNAAYVLCHNLSARLRDVTGEQKALELFVERITKFTPNIFPSPPDTLLLEISGSLRLFGGFDRLYDLIRDEFSEDPVISVAPSPSPAALLVRNGMEKIIHKNAELKSALGELRIKDVDLPLVLVQQLEKCGLQTLRDLWRLPRPDLTRRFGVNLIDFLDKACGAVSDPRKRAVTRTRFFQNLELPMETRDSKLLVIAAEELFESARRFLHSRGSAVEKMIFKLWYRGLTAEEGKRYAKLIIRSQQADRHPQRFLPQFCEKLERMKIVAPVESISLRIDQVFPYTRQSEDLFAHSNSGGNVDLQDWQQLLDILAARLGTEMVYCVSTGNDHRPEKAWRRDGLNQKQWKGKCMQRLPTPSRPLWLLEQPRKTSQSQSISHVVGETERIECGWWDGEDIRRDYCAVVTRCGNHCWVFRDINMGNDFFIHGLYG